MNLSKKLQKLSNTVKDNSTLLDDISNKLNSIGKTEDDPFEHIKIVFNILTDRATEFEKMDPCDEEIKEKRRRLFAALDFLNKARRLLELVDEPNES